MKVYIAGPMRGRPAYNHPAFDKAAEWLRHNKGYEVFSPAEEDRRRWPDRPWATYTGDPETDGLSLANIREVLTADLNWIGTHADVMAFLPGWEASAGAVLEHEFGKIIGLQFIYISV